MNHSRQQLVIIFAILALALGLRVAAAIQWHRATAETGRLFRLGDSDSYWVLAGHIARGEPYEYGSPDASVFRAPLYPLVLAPFTLLSKPEDGVCWARLLGCLSGTWAVWLVMCLARRLTHTFHAPDPLNDTSPINHSRAMVAAGLMAAVYPGAIGMSIVILSEAIFCPLMLLTLMYWLRGLTHATFKPIALVALTAGVCSGLAILARPSWLLFMPLAGTVVLVLDRRRTHQLLVLMTMALGCILVMSPWWIRNHQVTGRFVPTTLQVGASLYDGLHAGASGGSDENMDFVNEFIQHQRQADQEAGPSGQPRQNRQDSEGDIEAQVANTGTFEYRLNASMQRAALDWTQKNISGAIRLALVKFARTWSLWPSAGEIGSSSLRAALTIGCFGVLGLACWTSLSLWGSGRAQPTQISAAETSVTETRAAVWWSIAICWAPAIYFTLLHMVFVGSIRYREPAVLVLTALAGCALSRVRWFGDGQGSRSLETSGGS
ncbi:MAG: hypothetical protein IT423_19105 [Pirellulaceae bacterium]|nr:hypothetical protein [Pirellulaceae bacterium]